MSYMGIFHLILDFVILSDQSEENKYSQLIRSIEINKMAILMRKYEKRVSVPFFISV